MDKKFDVGLESIEQRIHCVGVANIIVHVMVTGAQLLFETLTLPTGRGFVAEKLAAHVVVDANHVHPLAGKESACFGTNQFPVE